MVMGCACGGVFEAIVLCVCGLMGLRAWYMDRKHGRTCKHKDGPRE